MKKSTKKKKFVPGNFKPNDKVLVLIGTIFSDKTEHKKGEIYQLVGDCVDFANMWPENYKKVEEKI